MKGRCCEGAMARRSVPAFVGGLSGVTFACVAPLFFALVHYVGRPYGWHNLFCSCHG